MKSGDREIRVLLVDDHVLVRDGLKLGLSAQPDLVVVAEAADGAEAARLAGGANADIALLDIDMPGLDCFDAARQIISHSPQTRIALLSAFVHDTYIDRALALGVKAYISKQEPLAKVIEAIRKVAAGRVYFSDVVWRRIIVTEQGLRCARDPGSRLATLTSREVEVLRYISCGYSKREIAGIMNISEKTIETHTANLMNKLDIHDKAKLTRFAIQEGLGGA